MNKNEWVLVDCPACRNINREKRRACGFCDGAGMMKKSMHIASTDELYNEAEQDAALIQAAIDGELEL